MGSLAELGAVQHHRKAALKGASARVKGQEGPFQAGSVGPGLGQDAVRAGIVKIYGRSQLVGRLVGANPAHKGEGLGSDFGIGVEVHQEGVLRQVAAQLPADLQDGFFPFLAHRAGELDNVIAAGGSFFWRVGQAFWQAGHACQRVERTVCQAQVGCLRLGCLSARRWLALPIGRGGAIGQGRQE